MHAYNVHTMDTIQSKAATEPSEFCKQPRKLYILVVSFIQAKKHNLYTRIESLEQRCNL